MLSASLSNKKADSRFSRGKGTGSVLNIETSGAAHYNSAMIHLWDLSGLIRLNQASMKATRESPQVFKRYILLAAGLTLLSTLFACGCSRQQEPPLTPPAEVVDLATEIHNSAWLDVVSQAKTDEYFKYAIYASRTLAVRHPEVYLQGDGIFVNTITTNHGFKKAYEIKDVHSDYLFGKQPEGPSFSFDDVKFDEYILISTRQTYPDYYPFLSFLDRRFAPIATSLKTFDNRVTQLEKAEQLYFREKEHGAQDLFIIYCGNENSYLYQDGTLISMNNGEVENIEGNPILIFNEDSVWYPLMGRDDTKENKILNQITTRYSTESDEPIVSDFERELLSELEMLTEVETEKGLAFLSLASIHSGGKMPTYMSSSVKEKFSRLHLPLCPPYRAFNEKMNHLSPISAYLAAIAKVEGAEGTKTLCDEYLKYAATPDQTWWAHGHAWFCGMIDCGIEYSYRTHAGHCVVQAANIAAALELANVDRYWMAGFTFWKEGWGGHDFIYIPGQDLIVSNGKIEDLEDTVVDYADDTHRESPFKYLHFIEHRGKWANIGGNYPGTLSPNDVLGIFTYLREIHGDDIQAGKIVNNQLVPVPFDELKRNLEAEQ